MRMFVHVLSVLLYYDCHPKFLPTFTDFYQSHYSKPSKGFQIYFRATQTCQTRRSRLLRAPQKAQAPF